MRGLKQQAYGLLVLVVALASVLAGCGEGEDLLTSSTDIAVTSHQMQQTLFTVGEDFTITDASGRKVYFANGETFSLGDKLSLKDVDGHEVASISEKLLNLQETYEIRRRGKASAEVTKLFTFFRDKYKVDIPGPLDYEVKGDFWGHEYEFVRQGRRVAHVSKAFFSWSDTYGTDIVEDEDHILILATIVVIDLANQQSQHQSSY